MTRIFASIYPAAWRAIVVLLTLEIAVVTSGDLAAHGEARIAPAVPVSEDAAGIRSTAARCPRSRDRAA
jgi:hypothetical protein